LVWVLWARAHAISATELTHDFWQQEFGVLAFYFKKTVAVNEREAFAARGSLQSKLT